MMDVLTFLVLSHFHIGSMLLPLKSILPPLLHEDALCDSVMRNYTLINFGY